LPGSEVGEDDVAGYEVVDGWTEGEEGVYASWTVLMETEFMEVGIVGEATEAMGRLSRVLVMPRLDVGDTSDSAWSSGMSRRRRMSKRTSSGRCSICESSFIEFSPL
jgi:hypothetical protein